MLSRSKGFKGKKVDQPTNLKELVEHHSEIIQEEIQGESKPGTDFDLAKCHSEEEENPCEGTSDGVGDKTNNSYRYSTMLVNLARDKFQKATVTCNTF